MASLVPVADSVYMWLLEIKRRMADKPSSSTAYRTAYELVDRQKRTLVMARYSLNLPAQLKQELCGQVRWFNQWR